MSTPEPPTNWSPPDPNATSAAGSPIAPSAPSTPEPPDETAVTPSPDQPKRRSGALIAFAIVVALVLVIGAVIALVVKGSGDNSNLTDDPGAAAGAESPDAVIDSLIEAANKGDIIALTNLLDPAERRTLAVPTMNQIVPELRRIGIIKNDVDLTSMPGIDITLTNVTYEVTPTDHPDLYHARLTGGTSEIVVTPSELPYADAIINEFDATADTSKTADISEGDDGVIALVEHDGRWYVSLWHSMAENIRLEKGLELPPVSDQLTPQGSESPQAALEAFLTHLADLDLEGVLATIDPEEGSALYRYVPLFTDRLAEIETEAKIGMDESGVSWKLQDLEFAVDGDQVTLNKGTLSITVPDGTIMITYTPDEITIVAKATVDGQEVDLTGTITSTTITLDGTVDSLPVTITGNLDRDAHTITVDGTMNGQNLMFRLEADPEGKCSEVRAEIPGESEVGCLEDQAGPGAGTALTEWMDATADLSFGLPPVTTHELDGKWYLSPTLTAMNWGTTALKTMDDNSIDAIIAFLKTADERYSDAYDGQTFGPLEDLGGFDDMGDTEVAGDEWPNDASGPLNADPVSMMAGDTTTISVDVNDFGAMFDLVGPAGAEVTVVAPEIKGNDPYLLVFAPDSLDALAENDDYGDRGDYSAAVTFTMPADGQVVISVADLAVFRPTMDLTIAVGTPDNAPTPESLLGTN